MSHKRPQPRSLRLKKPSLLGDGLPERLRSTSFALLGLTAAAGLGLVAVAFHQGWPVAPDLPIPGAPFERGAVHGQTIVAKPTPETVDRQRRVPPVDRPETPVAGGRSGPSDSQLAAAHRVVPPSATPAPRPVRPEGEQPANGALPDSPSSSSPPPVAVPPPTPSPTPNSTPSPSSTASVEDADDNDEADDGDEDAAKTRGRTRSKGGWKHKAPPPPADEEAPEPSPPDYEDVPEYEDEPDADEAEEDQSLVPAGRGYGRGRGHWRHSR